MKLHNKILTIGYIDAKNDDLFALTSHGHGIHLYNIILLMDRICSGSNITGICNGQLSSHQAELIKKYCNDNKAIYANEQPKLTSIQQIIRGVDCRATEIDVHRSYRAIKSFFNDHIPHINPWSHPFLKSLPLYAGAYVPWLRNASLEIDILRELWFNLLGLENSISKGDLFYYAITCIYLCGGINCNAVQNVERLLPSSSLINTINLFLQQQPKIWRI